MQLCPDRALCTSGRLEVVVKHLDGHGSGAVANRDIREVVSTAAKLEPKRKAAHVH